MKKYWVYDYETMSNCFVAVFMDLKTLEQHVFVVNRERNDFRRFIAFLKHNIDNKHWHLGFNCISFDSQITEFCLEHSPYLCSLSSDELTASIYAYAQHCIELSNSNSWADYPEFKLNIPVIDIFKLNHWNSTAKSTSLKWSQFSLRWEKLEEMPYHHSEDVTNDIMLNDIISYCINDVLSTRNIFRLQDKKGNFIMIDQINIRSNLIQQYNVNLVSASEPKISKEIFLHYLSEKLCKDKKELRYLRTPREGVFIRDVLLPYIKFSTPEFNSAHNWFKNLYADTRTDIEKSDKKKSKGFVIDIKGCELTYALGGLHGVVPSGIYTSDNDLIIKSLDVDFAS